MNDIKEELKKNTDFDEETIIKIDEILNEHFIIGRKNKDKIVKDFIEKLDLNEQEADELYNKCSEIIVKGIFHKKSDE